MKKYNILTVIFLLGTFLLSAQTTEFDAMNLARRDINGTARYMGMAGAFGALGGDVSAIKDNPAGLGIYRTWEITTTFNMTNQHTSSKWEGTNSSNDLYRPNFSNFSMVMSYPTYGALSGRSTGLLRSNLGVSYNRLRDFNRNVTVRNNSMDRSITDYIADFTNANNKAVPSELYGDSRDFKNTDISWLTVLGDQSGAIGYDGNWKTFLSEGDLTASNYYLRERGYIDEYSLSWAGNISDMVYIGAALNLTTIYKTKLMEYRESYDSYSDLLLSNYVKTNGYGVNLNLGVIVRPFDAFRIGLAFQTPTRYYMTDDVYNTHISYNGTVYAPNEYLDYELRTPWKLTASAAYIIGTKAIISTDFVYTNYQSTKLYDDLGDDYYYGYRNDILRNDFKDGLLFKLGLEYRVTNSFSLRAGAAADIANVNSDLFNDPQLNTFRVDTDYYIYDSTTYFTFGGGYRNNWFYVDLAFVNKNVNEKFSPFAFYYLDSPTGLAKVTTHNYDIVATFGFRF